MKKAMSKSQGFNNRKQILKSVSAFCGILLKGGIMTVEKPSLDEILEAKICLENEEELTDRQIWILSEFDNEEHEFEYF